MARFLFAIFSFVLPGAGQLLQGQLWAAFGWLIIGILLPGIGNIGSAVHAFLDGGK